MSGGDYRLGIDFGTSTTVAMLGGPDGRSRPMLFDASPLLASAVFAGRDGMLLTGADAERAAAGYPAGFEANPKRRIDDATVWLGERELAVVDLIGAVLERVREEAVRVTGGPPAEVVLTHPAAWGPTRCGVFRLAALRAGLGEVRLVAEPIAAATYFAEAAGRTIAPGGHLMVYDLGAGTCDVSVVRRDPAGFTVCASAGLDGVGGLDLDHAVLRYIQPLVGGTAWARLDRPLNAGDQQARQALWRNARAAKEQLSRHGTADLHVPMVDRTVHLTRAEFEAIAEPILAASVDLAARTLRRAGVDQTTLGGVFLVGGSSRVPLAATLLHRHLGRAPTVLDQPELVVAEGSLLAGRPPADAVRPPSPSPATDDTPPYGSPHIPADNRDPAPDAGTDHNPRQATFVIGEPITEEELGELRPGATGPIRRRFVPVEDQPSALVARYLLPTERFRGEWRRHPVVFAGPLASLLILATAGATAAYLLPTSSRWLLAQVAYWLWVTAWFGWRCAQWWNTRFALTNRRLIDIKGVPPRDISSLALNHLTDVSYVQNGGPARVLGYGTMYFDTGNYDHALAVVRHLPHPHELYLRITEELYEPEAVEARLAGAFDMLDDDR